MSRWLVHLIIICSLSGAAHAVAPISKTLPNGLRLLMVPSEASPLVSVELLLDASACDERFPTREAQTPWVRTPGMRKLMLTGMMQGSAEQDGVTLRRKVTTAGGMLEMRVQQDVMELSVTVPANALAIGLSALAEIACRPQLSDGALQTAITRAQADLALTPSGVTELAEALSRKTLFANHPYASAGQGDARMLRLMTPEMVRFLYPYFVRPDAAVLSIVGKCVPDDAQALVTRDFGDWKSTREPWTREDPSIPVLAQSRVVLQEDPVSSHCVMLSFPVCGIHSPDYLVLRLIDVLLGGGTGARLFRGVREEQHLAYEVSSRLTEQRDANSFSMYAVIDSAHLEATKEVLVKVAQQLQAQPGAPEELARAKAYFIGRTQLSHQANAIRAYELAWDTLSGQDSDDAQTFAAKVNAITSDDIQRVATQYFTHYLLVVITPNVVVGG